MKKQSAVIILVTAHLSTTPGKGSPDNRLREAEYSRSRARAIKAILQGYGYTVFIDYEDLMPNQYMKAKTAKEEQNKELEFRVNKINGFCNLYGVENCIAVAIHVDAAGMGKDWMSAGGWSVITTPGNTKSDTLAECLADRAEENLKEYAQKFFEYKAQGLYGEKQQPFRYDKSDGDRDKEASLYVLRRAKCPAVLTENLFMDNKQDVEFLLSDAGKHAIERLHVEGIMQYIKNN